MNIYCLSIVKDEDDIIGDVLLEASKWADKIFIADNGSTDNTVKIIHNIVEKTNNIEFLGIVDEPFTDEIRGKLFSRISSISKDGDWWCRLDADEFYIDNPIYFLKNLPNYIDHVWAASYQFYFTDKDYLTYQKNPSSFLNTPLKQRLRYYLCNWSEPRFAKHTSYFEWPTTSAWPNYMLKCSPKRIRLRTYQHRSPEQVVKRLQIRNEVVLRTNGNVFSHILNIDQSDQLKSAIGITEVDNIQEIDFRSIIKDHTNLDELVNDSTYKARENLLPRLPNNYTALPIEIIYYTTRLFRCLKALIKTHTPIQQ